MGNTSTPITSAKNMPTDPGAHYGAVGIFITPERPRMNPTPARLKHFSAGMSPRDMRDLCRARNLVYFGGVADEVWLSMADRIRQGYIDRVGLRQYILDMLPSKIAWLPANQAAVVLPDGSTVTGRPQQKIVDFLLAHFADDDLPYRLDVRRNLTGQIEILTYSL